jgi:NitT/TauT family transport system substrate-binding protein
MIKTIRPIAVALTMVGLCHSPGHAQTPNVKLAVDFVIQGQQSPFVLAAGGGYFARAGVNVQVDRGYGSGDSIVKVASGAYDMAFADIGAMIQFDLKQGAPKVISVFQVFDAAPMLIMSLKKSNITKPSDLAGKRVASPPGASSRVMFPLFASVNHLDLDSIKWIDVTPQLRETLLVQGQADATTALITDIPGLKPLGLTENDISLMRFKDFGISLYGHCILTTPAFLAKNPDTVRKVVKGYAEALKAAIADPGVSIAALKNRESLIDEGVERARLELVINNAIVTDEVKQNGLGTVNPERMKQTVEMIAQSFKLTPLEATSLYRTDFMPPQAELRLP